MTTPPNRLAEPLLDLMEELVASIELRDAGDPDAPPWEAASRIARLEEELARRVRAGEARRAAGAVGSEEALAGIV